MKFNYYQFLLVLVMFSILFMNSCVRENNVSLFDNDATNDSRRVDDTRNDDLQSQSQVRNQTLHSTTNQEDLPICKTVTARNCRFVDGVTENPNVRSNLRNPFESETRCHGNGTVTLVSPMNINDIDLVIPMGAMVGGHVTPIDHMYLSPVVFHSEPDTYDVYADADGVITDIAVEPNHVENKYKKIRFTIMHTCDFYSIYNLLTSLSPELNAVTGEMSYGDRWSGLIVVKKGQLLGKIGGQTLDLSVNYNKVQLPGFIVPEHYNGEFWKIHTVDPFDYFEEPSKSQLLTKNIRMAEPRGGKIDYDIDGRLVGNWFEENTGGYNNGGVNLEYWKTHLSFAYNHLDPTRIMISMGNYGGTTKQAAVKGNFPDPKDISESTGLVKYELVTVNYVLDNGQLWDHMSVAKRIILQERDMVEGTVLVQMISPRTIKFESFPNKTISQIEGFSANARVYER